MRRIAIGICAALALPSAAAATELQLVTDVDASGWPVVTAIDAQARTGVEAQWRVCDPLCGAPVTATQFAPGAVPAGAELEASTELDGVPVTARTPAWQGQVVSVAPPQVMGAAAVGAVVTAVDGTWAGGWGGEGSRLGLIACPAVTSQDCRRLPVDASAVLDSAYAGWFIGAISQRGTAVAQPAWPAAVPGQPSMIPAPPVSQTLVAGPLIGPVAAAIVSGPVPGGRDAAPEPALRPRSITLRPRGKRAGRAVQIGRVRCAGRCRVQVTVRGPGVKRSTTKLTVRGKRTLMLARRYQRAPRVTVTVRFLGTPPTQTTTRTIRRA